MAKAALCISLTAFGCSLMVTILWLTTVKHNAYQQWLGHEDRIQALERARSMAKGEEASRRDAETQRRGE